LQVTGEVSAVSGWNCYVSRQIIQGFGPFSIPFYKINEYCPYNKSA